MDRTRGQKRIDTLVGGSLLGVAVSIGLGVAVLVSPEFNAVLAGGSASLYDAAIWMAEMCRFD